MIFASLGTMDMAFVRMAEAIDEWAATTQEEVIVQTGYTHFNYRHAKAFDFCTKDEMQQYIKSADILILQGGWGAISEAMEQKKRIVVIPRHDKTEHIHDQFPLIRNMYTLGYQKGVFDKKELRQKIRESDSFD